MGSRDGDGYGQVSINDKMVKVHRFVYELTEKIPERMCVLHKCDNPSCVNPYHLFIGTHKDNSDDKVKKDRQPKGEKNGNSKLTEQDVLDLRTMYTLGFTSGYLAGQFGINRSTVCNILKRKWWKHIP